MTPLLWAQFGAAFVLIAGCVGLMLWIVRKSKKLGKMENENEQIHGLNEVQKAQLDVAARPPVPPSAVLDRMRRGDL